MTPRAGGEAGKFGDRYEGRWTVGRLLEVLADRALWLVVEDEADLAEGAEFTLCRADGQLEVHQVKRQFGLGATWTPLRLGNEGVLDAMALHADAGREFRFISMTPTPWLAALADRARRSDDLDGFIRVQLDGAELRRAFNALASDGIWGTPEHAWAVLRRVDAHCSDERQLVEINAVLAERYLSGADPRLMAVGLGDLITENLGVRLDARAVHRHLPTYGMAPNPLVERAPLAATVAATVARWSTSITSELLTPEIPRHQASAIVQRLVGPREQMILVSGTAGTGKSAVLRQAVAELATRGWPALAFRVDRLEPFLTARELAAQLDLGQANPVVALATVAGDLPSVLVVDQLDAVSFASGRLPRQLDPIAELLEQTRAFPQMRVLLACRQYDLDNDSRLGALTGDDGVARVEIVGALTDDEIDAAVRGLGVDPARLSSEQRSLLSSPLNLVLLAATADETAVLEFSGPKDLLDRFYVRKQRECGRRRDPTPVRFSAVIARLAERMSAKQRLSLPLSVLDADDLIGDAEVLASGHVITFDRGKVAFFHEAFFDYVFARAWVDAGRDLQTWLLDGDQELFRRGQVRQILTHLRDIDPARFIAELRDCLKDERVRVHIKDVMLSVLGSLPSPSRADWELAAQLLEGEGWMSERAWSLLRTEPWFARTDAEGVLAGWFGDPDEPIRARAIEIARAGAADNGDRVAELLATLGDRDEAARALLWVARPPALARSRPLFERALAAVREGSVSGQAQQLFIDTAHVEREDPLWAIELIAAWLSERPGALAVSTLRVGVLESQEYGLQRLIIGAGRAQPATFARTLMPYVISVAQACAYGHDRYPIPDLQFGDREPHKKHPDVGDTLLSTIADAARMVATDQIEILDELLGPLLAEPYDTAQWLAYQALTAAGASRASQSADLLLESQARLQSGYPTNPYWATRELLLAIAEHLDQIRIDRLQAAILALEPEYERARGYARFTLLSALPESRLSAPGARQLGELRKEFGQDQPDPPPPSITVANLEPSLAPTSDFSDDQWLAAMRDGTGGPTMGMAADATWRLAQTLGEATKLEPARFAKLALRIDASFDPAYLLEVLKALADPSEPVAPDTIWSLVRHAGSLQVPEHSRWIGWPLRSVTGENIPDDILDLLIDVALRAPDPVNESAEPQSSGTSASGMFVMSGLNSARGQAASTLARLIATDGDGSRTARVARVLGQLARDPSLGVRAIVADVFSACLIHARAETTASVPALLDTDDRVLAAPSVQNLLYYLVATDLGLVLGLVDRMLASADGSVRGAGGSMAAYIALELEHPQRLDAALRGDAASRAGAARLCARRLPFAGDAELATRTLTTLVDDEDQEVRVASAEVAVALREQPLRPYTELLNKLIASRAFADALPQLQITLQEAPDDPSGLLAVTVERFLEEFRDELGSFGSRTGMDARELGELVIRWYGRSESDPVSRRRALDILDQLLASESYGIADLVGEAERQR